MANTAGVTTSFKSEVLTKQHNLNSDALKMALYQTSANVGPTTYTAYTATGEVASANYSAGGNAVTNGTVATTGSIAYWTPSANLTWSNVTYTTDCSGLYNSTAANKSIALFTFGTQTIAAGNFQLTMPTNDSSNALIRLN